MLSVLSVSVLPDLQSGSIEPKSGLQIHQNGISVLPDLQSGSIELKGGLQIHQNGIRQNGELFFFIVFLP